MQIGGGQGGQGVQEFKMGVTDTGLDLPDHQMQVGGAREVRGSRSSRRGSQTPALTYQIHRCR